MKFSTVFTAICLSLPAVLGSAIPAEAADAAPAVALDFTTFVDAAILTAPSTSALDGDASFAEATALQVRAPGAIEARQAAGGVAKGIAQLIQTIINTIRRDNLGRGEFTKGIVREGRAQWPQFNWVVCHTKHSYRYDGVRGQNWGHYHREYDIQIGGTIGYEIYWFESGTFERHGDGGFLNWAYIGDVHSTWNNGASIRFN